MGKHYKRKSKNLIILSILRIIFFITLIISSIYILKWYMNNKENEKIKEEISKEIIIENIDFKVNKQTKYKINFDNLKEKNKDVVAWLKVNGTEIEYPVVQSVDNNYYLKQNFNKKYNNAGWIFADYRNKLDGTDKNIIIYGHNIRNNSMFGTLKNILKQEWYNNEENYVINFVTEKEEQKYQVFSVYEIEKEDYYIKTNFVNKEFSEFIQVLKQRSVKDFGVDINSEDSILTLSTCSNNNEYRVVLHAKKIK